MSFHYEKIDHVQLAAPKGGEDRARAFYQGLLGFEELEKPENLRKRGGVWFQSGSFQLHIGIDEPFYPAKKAHPAIRVTNLEGLKDRLDNHHVSYTVDGDLPGADRFYMTDPFGNRLEFLEWL
ncbi:VOC family protein [Ornithinibacillus xuwenensis]|uniref:VOC family protein n=1 Tax=Ornithinibacillus xuwenensis TaxID=3144668 RepID=A0ABU9XHM8_9BACI